MTYIARADMNAAADIVVDEMVAARRLKAGDVPVDWILDNAVPESVEPEETDYFLGALVWTLGGVPPEDAKGPQLRRGLPVVSLTDYGRGLRQTIARQRKPMDPDPTELAKSIAGYPTHGRRAALYLAGPGDPFYVARTFLRVEQSVQVMSANSRKIKQAVLDETLLAKDALRLASIYGEASREWDDVRRYLNEYALSRAMLMLGDGE